MAKSLYLWVDGKGYTLFEYEELSELKEAFKERFIKIGSRTSIGDGTSIGSRTSIGDNLIVKSLGISGSKHFVNYWGTDCIQIGCQQHSVQYWVDNFNEIGVEFDYSEEQILEYGNYIQIIEQIHKSGNFLSINKNKAK